MEQPHTICIFICIKSIYIWEFDLLFKNFWRTCDGRRCRPTSDRTCWLRSLWARLNWRMQCLRVRTINCQLFVNVHAQKWLPLRIWVKSCFRSVCLVVMCGSNACWMSFHTSLPKQPSCGMMEHFEWGSFVCLLENIHMKKNSDQCRAIQFCTERLVVLTLVSRNVLMRLSRAPSDLIGENAKDCFLPALKRSFRVGERLLESSALSLVWTFRVLDCLRRLLSTGSIFVEILSAGALVI